MTATSPHIVFASLSYAVPHAGGRHGTCTNGATATGTGGSRQQSTGVGVIRDTSIDIEGARSGGRHRGTNRSGEGCSTEERGTMGSGASCPGE